MAFSLCPLAFFKGATTILYQHNKREQYGIGKIVATRVFALMFSLTHPSTLSPSKVFFLRKTRNKPEKLQKILLPSVLIHFLRYFCESQKNRSFVLSSRVRPISDEISADNFVLVVNAREYKTHEKQKNRCREESIGPPPLQRLSVMAIHHVSVMLKSSK
jgi:hypothetical protein